MHLTMCKALLWQRYRSSEIRLDKKWCCAANAKLAEHRQFHLSEVNYFVRKRSWGRRHQWPKCHLWPALLIEYRRDLGKSADPGNCIRDGLFRCMDRSSAIQEIGGSCTSVIGYWFSFSFGSMLLVASIDWLLLWLSASQQQHRRRMPPFSVQQRVRLSSIVERHRHLVP